MWLPVLDHKVNRHTGGLEMHTILLCMLLLVNRHTGGLEMQAPICSGSWLVNRHTGGLEIFYGGYDKI